MAWEIFSIIGTIAFALSGAIVAMEEDYDIFGVYILGMATTFWGGALRNLLMVIRLSRFGNKTCYFKSHFYQ